MKRAVAVLLAFALIAVFASCGGNEPVSQSESESTTQAEQTFTSADETVSEKSEESSEAVTDNAQAVFTESTTLSDTVSDPSEWTKEEIIEYYKKAAAKSHPKAKSTQIMVLEELIINDGDGALGFFIKILEPAIASVIEKNALEFDGITGGFTNLTVADAQSIKAYSSGEYTVIEMTMKPQTDGIHGKEYEGSVGHAITVLGDVSKVLAEFPQFEVDMDNADVVVKYVNPTVKVKINKDGIIEKGTWKYTCDPEIRNITISGITIKKADAKIDYIITVGGGF